MLRNSEDLWEAHRRRMLEETERFIEWGLRNPDLVNWIPAKPVEAGRFPRKVAEWFYDVILRPDGDGEGSWRRRLRGLRRLWR